MSHWDNVLYFAVRHGESAANDLKIYRSWSNSWQTQLSKKGRRDAEEAGEYLLSIGAPVEIILSDSLDRTAETAEIIARVMGVGDIHLIRALHPLNMGDLTLQSKEGNPVEKYLENTSLRLPNGDTVDEFDEREFDIFGKINTMAAEMMGGRIVVVGHGSNISFLFNRMFNRGEKQVGYEGLVDPGGVVAVSEDGLEPLTKVREKHGKIGEKTQGQKLTAIRAGYMELPGAVKDAGCSKVDVPGGVSKDLGCCNLYEPKNDQVTEFRCGECEYLVGGNDGGPAEAGDADLGGADDRGTS